MSLEGGTTLGPYEIVTPIGAGGMGEVYRAKDTRLDRTVAVKVLPEHLAESEERKERFEREAKAISQLNHPNICTLYDVGEQDGVAFLVMEHIEGETLADRLKKGPLPVDKALDYGMQIADGLDKAHRAGIVHRDLKPANAMLTRTGVKLLDFGLAKLLDADDVSEASDAPTMQKNLTGEETIIGTLQYMAPEQLERKPVDARTDIFAFGNVLYEMLSGKKAFDADSQAGLIANIVHVEPPALANAAPALERTVKKCLAKDPDARWQSARDLVDELAWIAKGAPDVSEPVARTAPSRFVPGLLVASIVTLASLALLHFTESPPSMPVVTFDLAPPADTYFGQANAFHAMSPDGTTLVFVAELEGTASLWKRRLDSVASEPVPGTEDGSFPFWSPDSRSIGFFARGQLRRIDLDTLGAGRSQVVSEGVPNGRGTWNDRGDILFSESHDGVIHRVPARGGAVADVTALDPDRQETGHSWPQFLPDGNRFLYVALSDDGWMLEMTSLDSDDVVSVAPIESAAFYAPPGYILSVRQRLLIAQRVDPDSLELIGDPVPIASTSSVSPIGSPGFSVSRTGVLANRAERDRDLHPNQLLWYDRQGVSTPALTEPAPYTQPSISPDGRRLALTILNPEHGQTIWTFDPRGTRSRFTFTDRPWSPQWSPDGGSIYFSESSTIYRKDADGGSDPEAVFSDVRGTLTSISPDERQAIVNMSGARRGDIGILPLGDGGDPVVFVESSFVEVDGRFSPDGRFIAYASNQSGRFEVYVRPYPPAGGQWQVSTNGGTEPRWRGDGGELFYITPDRQLTVVPISVTPTFQPGVPHTLFDLPVQSTRNGRYDVAKDGQRFLVSVQENFTAVPITVTVNWPALLDR